MTGQGGGLTGGEELPERLVGADERGGEGGLGSAGDGDGVGDAVECHGPYPPGIHVRVDLADEGAVRLTQVRQLFVADEVAQVVEVGGGVRGGDVRE
ncbi:hypothetical protein QLQ12_38920 [Actinoplanes sp. NEAU-A12]|uniref:Uncharacterized protein n=1 Tax=Actinoplanes sandaracinus TaxID=3045177 RepID=A0ABT6WXV9_9ACTN|nr:hypothetical protein [Actinoplanes sandaracinus]MDI6104580.1 hypothetical protein [Actinoplanes sandaracinus]